MKKKTTAAWLSAFLAVICLTGFTFPSYPGLGEVHYQSQRDIGPGAVYTQIIADNASAGGVERVYTVEASLANQILRPYVFNGEVRGKYALGSMINWAKEEGYQVLAAINGDLYDTASGTPKGPVIHSGILMTGGYAPENSIAFSQSGAAYLSYSGIQYTMRFQKYQYTDTVEEQKDENGNIMLDENGNPLTQTTTEATITEQTRSIDFFNVPHGGANGLHLYNRHYASSTKTSGSCVEVILTVPDVSVANLQVGQTIRAQVTEVRTGVNNTPIADNQLVLSANSNSSSYSDLWNMVTGSEVEIQVSPAEGSMLDQAVESIGVYHVIARDGAVVTTDKTVNPRTCIGIKENGDIILYVVDGRQSGHSKGMNAVDIANYLLSLGCVSAVNLDGGGSTTMYARSTPGISDEAGLVNSVSDGSQRSVTNGLMLVYSPDQDMTPAHLCLYPADSLMMPGASQQLEVYAVNKNYEKTTALSGKIDYSVTEGMGTVDSQSVFTAGTTPGEAVISASVGEVSGSTTVKIVDDLTFSTNYAALTLDPGEVVDVNVTNPRYGHAQVAAEDRLFTWRCDPQIGTIDQNGVFTASSTARGEMGTITVSFGSASVPISVTVGEPAGFTDIDGHWAKEYILSLADQGIISGVTATRFAPDEGLTRAQFLVLLSKLDQNSDPSLAPASGFTDVKDSDWFSDYVNWGVSKGIVSGMGDGTFAPDQKVTREQMCVMLDKFMPVLGISYEQQSQSLSFGDSGKVSSWALEAVTKIVSEGIMTGKPDNLFDPQGTATRAEAARIIYVVKALYEYQMTDGEEEIQLPKTGSLSEEGSDGKQAKEISGEIAAAAEEEKTPLQEDKSEALPGQDKGQTLLREDEGTSLPEDETQAALPEASPEGALLQEAPKEN